MSEPSITIDSFELARSLQRITGEVAVARLQRLSEMLAQSDGKLRYQIDGVIEQEGSPAADLRVNGRLYLVCQRCNGSLEFDFDRTARFRFVANEDVLNSLPIEDDEVDAIVGSRAMNVYDWVEDEVILSLPLVPRHDECSAPISNERSVVAAAAPNPFAVLAALRNDGDDSERRN